MNGINWNRLDPATKKVWRMKGIIIFGLIWLFTCVPTIIGWYYTPDSDPNRRFPSAGSSRCTNKILTDPVYRHPRMGTILYPRALASHSCLGMSIN